MAHIILLTIFLKKNINVIGFDGNLHNIFNILVSEENFSENNCKIVIRIVRAKKIIQHKNYISAIN